MENENYTFEMASYANAQVGYITDNGKCILFAQK
jgi:hypothetical protein